ncbi:MAG TPA: M14 family zinc carboxypeptidase [Thermoanaerobaculia bacterium]|nr:M14 family zinc carboxypeptidase [Thermoanaerobaculia bacterium]
MFSKTSVLMIALALGLSLFFQGAAVLPAQTPANPPVTAPATAPVPSLLAPLSSEQRVELPALDERVPSPAAVLGYPLGSRFTHWDRIVTYLQALTAASPRVRLREYGRTYEGRPLHLVVISTPENLARLEEIRQERLRLADPGALSPDERERLSGRVPAVLWLAYGVHGNESSSAEAAMAAAYVLAAAQGETAELLRDLIVIIDPLSNPDGRERYVSAFEQRQGREADPHRAAAEHWEPWPGGRQNHYAIDLNRDWAWMSQVETQQRIAAYRAWEPQVYVDFHEMGSESSYFFPPAADPVHPRIDRRIVSWLDVFGRANAQAFDRQGWIYFKSENFDLFYPGYGDSYPSLRGAVGMTYEMAGGGRAGLALELPDGSVLTLADRVARHLTTSLATFRTAGKNSRRLLQDFVANRLQAASSAGPAYLWAGDQQEAGALADLLTSHGVRVERLGQAAEVPVRSLRGERLQEEAAPRRFPAGTYVVSASQPLGTLVRVLMELDSPMAEGFVERQRERFEQSLDGEFYDITAWSLPLAYNLETWVADTTPRGLGPVPARAGGLRGTGDLGFLVPPGGIASYRLAAELQRRGIRHRVALAGFTAGGTSYPAGTLFVPRHGNPADVRDALSRLLTEAGIEGQAVASSYEVSGLSLGSNDMAPVRPVRVGLLSGAGVDPTSFGSLWHLLDQQVRIPHDRLDTAQLRQVSLRDYDVLLLPSGDYTDAIGERSREALDGWVKGGGVLVAVGDAIQWLRDNKMTEVKKWASPAEEPEGDPESDSEEPRVSAERPINVPGAVVATRLQARHPLTLGLTAPPAVLVEGTTVLEATGDPRKDVLVATDDPVVAGFAWPEAEERLAGSLLVGAESRGQGAVIVFAQEPAFRLFWRATTPILLNALLYAPSAGLGGRS